MPAQDPCLNPVEQLLHLHRLLSGARVPVSRVRIEEELRCSRATAKRAIERLRTLFNAPIFYERERDGYLYRTDDGAIFQLPGLWFSAEEVSALLILEQVLESQPLGLLAETLKPFRGRLESLARQRGVGMPDWRHKLRLLSLAARGAGTQFGVVADALVRGRRLRIDYHGRASDRMAPREVSPQRLCLYRDNWYLDAWCHVRESLRTFALDRIVAAEGLSSTSIAVPDAQLQDSLETSYGIFSGTPNAIAQLRFSAHAARWVAAEVWHPQQRDERDEQGRLVRSLPYRREDELVMDILRQGAEVEVLAPLTLRTAVAQRLRAALMLYSDAQASASARRPDPRQDAA